MPFSTSATSTSPPREASYIRRRQTALQLLQSELYEFTTFYSERRTPTRSIGTPAQRVRHLPHWALFTRRPLTSTSSLHEAPSSLNAFLIDNETSIKPLLQRRRAPIHSVLSPQLTSPESPHLEALSRLRRPPLREGTLMTVTVIQLVDYTSAPILVTGGL